MARVYPLFSSSEGNATYIGNQKSGILIDAGVSCKRLVDALSANDIPVSAIQGIFITHEHIDHIRALKVLTKKYALKVFAENLNAEYLSKCEHISPRSKCEVLYGETEAGGFSVTPFTTPHDTRQSCGYKIITPDGKKICVCTDLGEITQEVHENLSGSELVLLESNYDYNMLKNGPYPYMLKKRISSDHGHLDNTDCGKELFKLVSSGTIRIVLGHLSQHNNLPAVAEAAAVSALSSMKRNSDYILMTASVSTVGEVMIV